jgi:hypothetical protein
MRLSPALLAENPCLEFATAGVLTNFEAKAINNIQIFRFAEQLDDPVFRTISGVVCTNGFSVDAAEGYIAMDVGACELEQFWVRGMPVVVGERPPALSPSYGIANGRHGFFHSFGFDDPAAATGDWSNHPRHFNNGDAVEVPSPDFINVKFLFDKPKGENLDEWSIIVAFRAKSSTEPMKVPLSRITYFFYTLYRTRLPLFTVVFFHPFSGLSQSFASGHGRRARHRSNCR